MSVMAVSRAPLVAHVIHRLDYGGLENGLVNLVNHMPVEHYRHAVICLAGFGTEFRKRIHSNDVQVISLDKHPGNDVGVYWRMWRTLRRLRPSIVHTRNLGTVDMQWVAAMAGVPHRAHGEHGWDASDPQGQDQGHLRIRRACRPVIGRYVPMSQDLARWLECYVGVAPKLIHQIYSGVDTGRFSPASFSALPRDDRGEGSLVIGTVGRLDPVKNQGALLRAFSSVVRRNPAPNRSLRLTIVGDGPLRGELENLARDLGLTGCVRFAGASDDIPAELRAMDVFVLSSLNEGISNTILEAMATGLPVVASRVGGNPELVLDGTTGCLYDPTSSDALETVLSGYVTDPSRRRSHGSAARSRVMQKFSLEAMVQHYLDLYDELLAPSCPRRDGAGVSA